MPSALQLAGGDPRLVAAVRRARRLLHRKALLAAAASAVPLPGVDFATDAAVLVRMIPAMNAEFGLTPEQIARLEPAQREAVRKAVELVGSLLVGKFITRDLVLRAAKTVGLRMTARQASKYVPLAGQVLAAAIGYGSIRLLGEQHLKDCVRVARDAQLLLPAPSDTPKAPGLSAGTA
ncbi:hypothetical protein [Pseudorhodoferax sp.]|uniref:hypothetical protein n=1 Tax=Pseudorhodoferax sp. TaxID=1993553 RepID=UPI0039E500F3